MVGLSDDTFQYIQFGSTGGVYSLFCENYNNDLYRVTCTSESTMTLGSKVILVGSGYINGNIPWWAVVLENDPSVI